jgi:hypothetical protein
MPIRLRLQNQRSIAMSRITLAPSATAACLGAALLLCTSCGEPPDEGTRAPPGALVQVAAESASLILYVSNQSTTYQVVDAAIWIDDRRAFDGELPAGEGEDFQHQRQTLAFDLASGPHRIKAVTRRGRAEYEGTLDTTSKAWATLNYWADSADGDDDSGGRFSFDVSDQPLHFE